MLELDSFQERNYHEEQCEERSIFLNNNPYHIAGEPGQMGIEIYATSDSKRKSILFSLSQNTFQRLQSSFDALEAKTGNQIDPYGDSRLHQDHLRLILKAIQSDQTLGVRAPDVLEFRKFLENHLASSNEGLFLIGD
jgi:hypothetical protein